MKDEKQPSWPFVWTFIVSYLIVEEQIILWPDELVTCNPQTCKSDTIKQGRYNKHHGPL